MYSFGPHIKENLAFLQKLAKTKSDKKKNTLVLNATADQILAIVEICLNILRYNFVLKKRQKNRLAKFADYYRAIARTRTEKGARKQIIQKGNGIALAAILIPIVSAIASHFIEKALPTS
jgi:hypothetical protein